MAAERIKFSLSELIYIKNSEINPSQHRENLSNKSKTHSNNFAKTIYGTKSSKLVLRPRVQPCGGF